MEEPDMVNECGISLYFRNNRIHIRKGTIEVLNHPAYVHLFINEGKKQMFIQSCEKNKDAFRVYYKAGVERTEESLEENTVLHADNNEPEISCEKSKKDSLNNGKNSSTIEINPVMDKTENSNLSSDSSKERSVGPKEIAVRPERFYINAKSLLDYLSKIIGVDRQSESLRYYGELLPDGKTLYVDLTKYEVIPYGG